MATTAAAPTTELGAQQHSAPWAAPVLDETEVNRDLTWPRSVRTYAAMLNDAQIEGLYRGATLPIRSYRWYLEPNGARPETVQRISADYGLPIGRDGTMHRERTQRRFRFDRHLEDALRAIGYGHYFFEQVGEIGPDGLWHLRKLAPRPPRTVLEIKPARDGGLAYIKVPALNQRPHGGLPTIGGVELPVDRLVAYVWDQEGANWKGRSMLRSLYRPWKLKDRVLRVGAINIERAGGVPYVEAPEGATSKQMAELHALASTFRVGESAGAALPHGAQLKFAQAAGGDQAINFVRLQNEEMAGAWLMMFKQLGQTQTGSRALGETFVDYFALIQEAIAGWFCDIFNEHQIEDDVEWNDGPEERYAPLLAYAPAGDPVGPLADALDNAQANGALPADSRAAAAVRGERRGRPQRQVRAATQAPPEERARTDFEALQQAFEDALQALQATWTGVQAAQIADLVEQVRNAGSAEDLAAIAPAVPGAQALVDIVAPVLEHGAQTAVEEASAQGADIPEPDLTDAHAALQEAVGGVASLLSQSLGQSASSRAMALWGGALSADEIAGQVQQHLESLAGATPAYEFAGLVTRAQNQGRVAAMGGAPDGTRYYASELNDENTCDACAAEDGQEFDTLDDALADYPSGGYVGCEGGNRCRGTIVAVYAEDA